MATTSTLLRDVDELALMGYEIAIESRLGLTEDPVAIHVSVQFSEWETVADKEEVAQVSMALCPDLDYDLCFDYGQDLYGVWVQLYNAELLDDPRLNGPVLVVTGIDVQPEHQGASVPESLLRATLDHLAPLASVVLVSADTLGQDIDPQAVGLTPLAGPVWALVPSAR